MTTKTEVENDGERSCQQRQKFCHVFALRILLLLWGFWFYREVFCFAVRYLVLPWSICFCCEVFGFALTFVGRRRMSSRRWNVKTREIIVFKVDLSTDDFSMNATKPDAEKQFHCICWQETDSKGYDGDRRFGLGWREFQTSLAKCGGKKRNLPCVSMQVAQYLHDQELLRRHPDLHLFWSRLTDLKENSTKRGFSQPYPRRCPQGTCLARCQSFVDRPIALASGFGPLSENVWSTQNWFVWRFRRQ